MNILLTGGGTGGHLVIAQALKEEFIKNGHTLFFIGSSSGQDRKWFENDSDFKKSYFFDTTGVVNKSFFGKFGALFKIFKAFLKSRKIIKENSIDAIISVGGFSAAPASFAALTLQKPFFIHEQNARIGKLNSILKKYADAFFSSYDVNSPVKDYPIKEKFFKNQRIRKKINTVIFLGGSQGASFINDLALHVAPLLSAKKIHIIHQCGEQDFQRVQEEYKKLSLPQEDSSHVELYSFTNKLDELISKSDFAISRAGASTLWELCASGVPSLFIPYPYAAANHQFHNARFISDKKLGFVMTQNENVEEFLETILDLDLEMMSKGLIELTHKNGAKNIVEYIQGELNAT